MFDYTIDCVNTKCTFMVSKKMGLALIIVLTFTSCILSQGLKDYYKDYFPIGVSVGPLNLSGIDSSIIVSEFSSITAENIMKMGPIHPEENTFNWQDADQMIAFANLHGLKVRGHTLVWHRQTGNWLFEKGEKDVLDNQLLLDRMQNHIYEVAGRYKGKIYAWDVVNEVISDEKDEMFRPSEWYKITGEEFIYKAFQYAHQADPEALLFYNDYNTIENPKREKIIALIKKMQENNIPIHGIGLQGHWNINSPTEAELRAALDEYSALGLQIQITELDISIYPHSQDDQNEIGDGSAAFTKEIAAKQAAQYEMIFRVFRDYKDHITNVTFWNVSDRRSWLDNHPVRGRKNYPLLFDQNGKRKKAYDRVVDF